MLYFNLLVYFNAMNHIPIGYKKHHNATEI